MSLGKLRNLVNLKGEPKMTTLLNKYWNGHVYGTNTGKLSLEFTEQEAELKAVLRFMDDGTGPVVYHLTGNSNEGIITLNGTTEQAQENVEYGALTVECSLTSDGTLRGRWSTTVQTGGTFVAYPFPEQGAVNPQNPLPQLFTKRINLGFIQIYREEIVGLVDFIRKDFPVGKMIITYQDGVNADRAIYYEDFLQIQNLTRLDYLKIFISEPEGNGINRLITVELRAFGLNELIIQGSNEAWVLGRAAMTSNFMRGFTDVFRGSFNRFFGAFQVIIFTVMVVLMTIVQPLQQKIFLAIGTFVVLQVLPLVFSKLFPNAIIKMGEGKPKLVSKFLSRGGNWIAVITFSALGTVLTKYGEDFIRKLIELF